VLNDGASLARVADASGDVVVSWDSLVHADPGVLEAYVHALAQKLVPGGRAFLHHSNLGAFRPASAASARRVQNPHWRDEHIVGRAPAAFRGRRAGLALDAQELLQWGSPVENDCLSWLRVPPRASRPARASSGGIPPSGPRSRTAAGSSATPAAAATDGRRWPRASWCSAPASRA
jgi:hypothetical protein